MGVRLDIDLSALDKLIKKVESLGENIEEAMVDPAHQLYDEITKAAADQMMTHTIYHKKHHNAKNMTDFKPKIVKKKISFGVGFSFKKSKSLGAIVQLYGARAHKQPKNPWRNTWETKGTHKAVKQDQELYNIFYGKEVKKREVEVFKKALEDVIRKRLR